MAQGNMLEGKVVLVTGAGGGIGRDIALQCAAQGARVVVNDLGASVSGEGGDAGPAQRVVEEIRSAGGEATANTDSVSEVPAPTASCRRRWMCLAGSMWWSTTPASCATGFFTR